MTDPTPVEILEIRDRPIEIHLADGAIIHFRPQVVSVTPVRTPTRVPLQLPDREP